MTDPRQAAISARPSRRMMVFVDGENLAFRYQEMLKQGGAPRKDVVHVPDVFVWHPGFTHAAWAHEVLRVTYYTYATGDEGRLRALTQTLREQRFSHHDATFLPECVSPMILKKDARARHGKGVDIRIAVDMLSNVYRRNVDSVLLLSGDGDFAPLLAEVRRAGVLTYVSAFSSGFNQALLSECDLFSSLDGLVTN